MDFLRSGTDEDAIAALRCMREPRRQATRVSLCTHEFTQLLCGPLFTTGPISWVPDAQPQLVSQTTQEQSLPFSRWSRLDVDDVYSTHLLRLFWTWDSTLSGLVHADLFKHAIYSYETSEPQTAAHFCSELLINSLLAYTAASRLDFSFFLFLERP